MSDTTPNIFLYRLAGDVLERARLDLMLPPGLLAEYYLAEKHFTTYGVDFIPTFCDTATDCYIVGNMFQRAVVDTQGDASRACQLLADWFLSSGVAERYFRER